MADKGESSSQGSQFNLTSLIALLTLIGGVLLVSKKLTSERPVASSERPANPGEDQTVEARLWEDPFKWSTNEAQAKGFDAFSTLHSQIAAHSQIADDGDPLKPIVLAVMVQGGTYSEDIESRIRSRFAVVSALGESHFVPESAEHLGAVLIPWPTTKNLRSGWLTNSGSDLAMTNFSKEPLGARDSKPNALECSERLPLSFEWYRRTEFYPPIKRTADSPLCLLVLWLDEDRFEDHPTVRLALLLRHLAEITGPTNSLVGRIALVGPRGSSTLRDMLLQYGYEANNVPALGKLIAQPMKDVLNKVDIFCATPSVMDEMVVSRDERKRLTLGEARNLERRVIECALTNEGFHSFHNFAATDPQLAREALLELKLRRIDLADTNQNLVLISEWDTFYGRALLLTYAAELGILQVSSQSRYEFVERYRTNGNNECPPNLLRFAYLRGLDGQTTKAPKAEAASAQASQANPAPLDQFKQWTPDDNQAIGEPQFDYLARLGDRIKEQEKALDRQGRGRIKAIAIAGSDVYDTLLILQALRPRFPEAVFFTTDLDARFWDPKELAWSRNLLVFGSYGLQVQSDLQGRIAPFRDGTQTAQFVAALAALGHTNLTNWVSVSPRRFEIGRRGAYDLSITNGATLLDGSPLYPKPRALQGFPSWFRIGRVLLILLIGGLFATLYWPPLRHLTWESSQLESDVLRLRLEDIGGPEGFRDLVARLGAS